MLINDKIVEIEDNYEAGSCSASNRIAELEAILEEKNEMIVRLKTKGSEPQSAYLSELVRVLTKKVAEKDELLRRMGH